MEVSAEKPTLFYGGKNMGNWNGNGRNGQNGCGCGCNLFTSLSRTLNNLLSTSSNGCGCNHNNSGCGCNQNGWNTYANGFVSGVNAANASDAWWEQNGNNCPCHGNGNGNNQNNGTATVNIFGGSAGGNSGYGCGCGSNADLSAYTACNNQCFDPYYAQQYGLYPFNQCNCNYGL